MTTSTITLNIGTGGAQPLIDTLSTVDGAAAPAGASVQMIKVGHGSAGDFKTAAATDPLPVGLYGQTVTGTLTAAGSVTITDLRGAATVTLEGVANAMTTNTVQVEVLTAAGTWEIAKWISSTGTAGAIGSPGSLTTSISSGSFSLRGIADVAGYVGCRLRSSNFAGTSFAVTMVTSYAPTTRIGPDVETTTVRQVNLGQVGGTAPLASFPGVSVAVGSGSALSVSAAAGAPSTTEVASVARTVTGNSGVVSDLLGGAVSGTLNITAVSGTTPTLDLVLQESPDSGTTWVDVYHFERVTALGVITMPSVPLNGRRRWSWTIAGTTPSFTFSVSSNRGGFAQFPRFTQFFDRTAGLLAGTLNAVSATYQIAGCSCVVAAVTLGAATTPAAYKLQGSIDGANWYDLSSAVTAVASATVALVNTGNLTARFGRVLVSVVGATQTGVVVALTGTD